VYEYGVGDHAEVASFVRIERDPGGEWRGIMSPGVRSAG